MKMDPDVTTRRVASEKVDQSEGKLEISHVKGPPEVLRPVGRAEHIGLLPPRYAGGAAESEIQPPSPSSA